MVTTRYLDVITENPHLSIFVLSELRDNSSKFLHRIKRLLISIGIRTILKFED